MHLSTHLNGNRSCWQDCLFFFWGPALHLTGTAAETTLMWSPRNFHLLDRSPWQQLIPCSLFFTQPVIFSVAGFPQEEIPGWKSHMLHGYYRAFPPSLHTVIIKITFPQVSLCKTSHTNSTAESLNWQTPDSVSNLFPSLYIKILCRNGQHIQCCWNPRVDLPTRNLWAKADV